MPVTTRAPPPLSRVRLVGWHHTRRTPNRVPDRPNALESGRPHGNYSASRRILEHLLPALLYIMLGSAIGGGARFLLAGWAQSRSGIPFPVGTLLVNVTGSFLLGFLLELPIVGSALGPNVQLMFTTGVCGGYTTFSTFSAESAAMIRAGHWGRASSYVVVSALASVAAVFAGAALARTLFVARVRH